ncbi:MopE-related protein [Polyangium fumosum]|uniref:Follistatin-like domain-containing protein n=1 Tax=Polyangium fumosum TaxID=889272 RepID=A0A4U1JH21_9BACT|nr:MopE-related protein [Polyangium fumosum]TKD10451.1 hypothetical protein E8A74_08380 [Polyangium fumosum]
MALFRQPSKGILTSFAALAGVAAAAAFTTPADAQEAAACLSQNPADWPTPSRPYFMIIADTSGSMTTCTTPPGEDVQDECDASDPLYKLNSCGMIPSRLNDAKCALRQTVQAFGGEVNFGLATYAGIMSGCPSGACVSTCGPANGAPCTVDNYGCTIGDFTGATSNPSLSCGNLPNCPSGAGPTSPNYPEGTWRNGGNIVVPLPQDPWWGPAAPASNVPDLLQWFDGLCGDNRELFADGATPIAGSLRSVAQYLRSGWNLNWATTNYCQTGFGFGANRATPLNINDRPCRSVNVILLTDGDETCETPGGNDTSAPVAVATDLYQNGVTLGTAPNQKNWKVPVYVINFAGGSKAKTDAIAFAGGTGSSYSVNNEVELAKALATIVSTAAKPEVCNNSDDNCNGCTDEGYKHYCNKGAGKACCPWANAAARTACLNSYVASITSADPDGNEALLPCTTDLQQTQPANWLCYDPKEICDEADNNCDGNGANKTNLIDEGFNKCGNPAQCPTTETCDGQDNDCDGLTDENVCPNCVPSPEVCDGCDNDCDGIADDNIPAVACGLATPTNCQGTQACKPAQPVPQPGQCVAGGGLAACQNSPQTETCDGIDNDCDGIVDDSVAPTACTPVGTPEGLVYGGTSQCKQGLRPCNSSTCTGFVGPSAEVCDGIDNDCDGQVDEGAVGVGTSCGVALAPCTPGTLACVNGALVCQGGTGPQAEVCDNVDNNCNGIVDEAPLADGPAAGQNGCWQNPGNCCVFKNLQWCPPAGGTCYANGTLTSPCNKGTLVCTSGAWACQGPVGPQTEQCDSADNDCNGMIDDVPGTGGPCGSDVGECVAGVQQCGPNGVQCVGQVGPSTEICDGKDNDCDGVIDDNVGGLAKPCGINQPPCSLGQTACVNGAIVCQGGIQAQAEVCDGVDNDCDGKIDDAPLFDAPNAGQNGCWDLPGNCCQHGNLEWCPPPNASCADNGTLAPPCNKGSLACQGALGWVCVNAKSPQAEACDGLDNNCDGTIDDGTFQGEGAACGTDTGQCAPGVIDCTGGILDCVGDVPPTAEACNGLDDDCDGTIDNGIVVGGSCTPPYDTTLYPGPRDKGACEPGTLQCDGMGGETCLNGTGPQPEICDGVDNDCDGSIDEVGPAPDGIDGTANPLDATQTIGGACGVDTGACQQGHWACLNGIFACLGGQGQTDEACDCEDNDCDGTTDEQDPNMPQICAPGNSCVKSGSACTCATPCQGGEFPCPPGQACEEVTSSETGLPLGNFCIANNCGDCPTKTVKDAAGKVLCAPAGTPADANCVVPPVCVCKGIAGCKDPCDGVTCGAGEVCSSYGATAGKCVQNNCYNVPCVGCDKACNGGSCVDNPCKPDSCPTGQVCKPNETFTGFTCVESCADKSCGTSEVCKDGQCVAGCDPACVGTQVCDLSQSPPACVDNKCASPSCPDGAYCDPLTGNCGNDPCEGVLCPMGQVCQNGDCLQGQGGSGGAGGGGGAGGAGGAGGGGNPTSTTGTGTGGAPADDSIWGLATGGGGCACDVGGQDRNGGFALALAALALGMARRRSSGRRGGTEVSR